MHASMLLLVWLVVAAGPQMPGGTVGGVTWVVTIFVCVLVHEFSHSLVARHFGVGVREIELLPIGGISKLERIPNQPRQELKIAVAGPLASVALGAVALVCTAVASGGVPAPALAGGAFWSRFAWFNLTIGAFNLVPALPLDGGRVLRAWFELREGPLRATHHAARLARVFALAMIVVGVFSGQFFVAIIGIFISVVSRTEEMSAEVHARLGQLLVRDVMVRSAAVVPATASAQDLRALFRETTQRDFPVVAEDGHVVGMVSSRRAAGAPDDAPVGRLAVATPTARPDMTVEAAGVLEQPGPIPVVDRGEVVGLLQSEDVLHVVQRAITDSTRRESAT